MLSFAFWNVITIRASSFISGDWCHWNNHVGDYIYPTDHLPDYTSILVPNVDNTRTSFLLDTIAKQHKVSFKIWILNKRAYVYPWYVLLLQLNFVYK